MRRARRLVSAIGNAGTAIFWVVTLAVILGREEAARGESLGVSS